MRMDHIKSHIKAKRIHSNKTHKMPEGSQANREEKRINIMGKIILFLKQTNFNAFAFILLFSPFLMLWQTHCFGI